jgi:hypothetical protein
MTANYSNCLDSLGTPSLFFPTTPPLTLASFHAVLNWVDSRAYLSLSCWVCSPFRAIGDNNDETHKVCAPIVERDHFERSVCYFLWKAPFLFLFCFFFPPTWFEQNFFFGGALACNYLVRWLGFIFMNIYTAYCFKLNSPGCPAIKSSRIPWWMRIIEKHENFVSRFLAVWKRGGMMSNFPGNSLPVFHFLS